MAHQKKMSLIHDAMMEHRIPMVGTGSARLVVDHVVSNIGNCLPCSVISAAMKLNRRTNRMRSMVFAAVIRCTRCLVVMSDICDRRESDTQQVRHDR